GISAIFACVIATPPPSAVPLFRDLILPIVDGARYVALAIILGGAGVAALAFVDARAVGVALLPLSGGTVSAAIGAMLFRGDGLAAAIGAGLRDPAVAIGLAI